MTFKFDRLRRNQIDNDYTIDHNNKIITPKTLEDHIGVCTFSHDLEIEIVERECVEPNCCDDCDECLCGPTIGFTLLVSDTRWNNDMFRASKPTIRECLEELIKHLDDNFKGEEINATPY